MEMPSAYEDQEVLGKMRLDLESSSVRLGYSNITSPRVLIWLN